ncbi:hypothetical protein [Streptomyces katrae]|uniref:hypothetical protein n=1 Tax=Streptomyces katrae TaxID=68223 RepID=UPI000AA93279|nr:hypothetical protein [Streptomyces katrae]
MSEIRLRAPLRAMRAAMFAAVCVALGALGHSYMSGMDVPFALLLGAFAVTAALAWTAAGRRCGPLGITTALLAVQAALHVAFSAGQGHGHGSAAMAGHHHPLPHPGGGTAHSGMIHAPGLADGPDSASGMADGMAPAFGTAHSGVAHASGVADAMTSATGMADGMAPASGMAHADMAHASGVADGLAPGSGMAHAGMAHSGMAHASGLADGMTSATGMADGTGSMSGMADGMGGGLADLLGTAGHGGFGMLAAHLLAGLFCALWLAWGEAAVFRLAGALGATALLAARPLARALVLLRTRPAPVPGPPAQRPSYRPPRRLRGAVHAHTAVRRGPPRRRDTRTTALRPLPARAV